MLCAFGQIFVSFEIANYPEESPRLALLSNSLRGVEGNLEDVPVDHMPKYLQSGGTVYHGLIEQYAEIDIALIFPIKQLNDGVKEPLMSEAREAADGVSTSDET